MSLLLFLILGGVAGWIASLMMGTDGQQGILLNVIVGIVGAFLGGLAFNMLGSHGVTGFNLWSLIVAVLGSVVLLALVRAVRR